MIKILKKEWYWLFGFLVFVLITRLGSLTREVIDWDECTFFVMFKDVLKENLPYVHLFDNKGPLLYFLGAIGLKTFGTSLFAVRLTGDLFLWIISIFTYLSARRFASPLACGIATLSMIGALSIEWGLWSSSEIFAMAFVMPAVAILLHHGKDPAKALFVDFSTGFLLSAATLTRFNLSILGVFVALLYILRLLQGEDRRTTLIRLLRYIASAAILPTIILLIYLFSGHLKEFFIGVIVGPLSFSTWQCTMLEAFRLQIINLIRASIETPITFGLFSVLGLYGLALFFKCSASFWLIPKEKIEKEQKEKLQDYFLVFFLFLGVWVSIVKSGAAWPHYLIQLCPFIAIFLAATLASSFTSVRYISLILASASIFLVAAYRLPQALQVSLFYKQVQEQYTILPAAKAIAADIKPQDKVWPLNNNLVLIYLNIDPPTKLVHADAFRIQPMVDYFVGKGYLSEDPFEFSLKMVPRYIVTDSKGLWFLTPQQRDKVLQLINHHYSIFYQNKDVVVFKSH